MTEEVKGQTPAETAETPAAAVTEIPVEKADTFSREYVEELRKENARYRTRAKEEEEKARKAEEAKLAEQGEYKTLAEKAKAELEALKQDRRKGEIRAAILLAAARAGIADPMDAYHLADLNRVDLSETGVVSGADEAIQALVASKPYLLKPQTAAPPPALSPSNPGNGPVVRADDLKKLTAEQIARMTPEEVAAALKNR